MSESAQRGLLVRSPARQAVSAGLLPLLTGGQSGLLSAYEPSARERIGNAIYDSLRGFGLRGTASSARKAYEATADFVPGLGDVLAANDFGRAVDSGDTLGAIMAGGGLALGVVPVVGDAANSAAKRARGAFNLDYFGSPVRILQNPTDAEVKGFLSRTKYKAARRIKDPDTGDIYIWDAADPTLHGMVAKDLGVRPVEGLWDVIGLD